MAISSLGLGSGLDLNGLLSNLLTAEQQPLVALKKKEASYQARISNLGMLKSSLSSLQSTARSLTPVGTQTASEKYGKLTATLGDSSLATVSVSSKGIAGNYTLSNISLAQKEQIRKDATSLGIPAAGGSDGELSIQVGSGTATKVAVKAGQSLTDIANAINQAGASVNATVINDGTSSHLLLTSSLSGKNNQITVDATANDAGTSWDGFDFTPPGAAVPPYSNNGWVEQEAAKSASVTVNGVAVTSDSNTLDNAITGVTLTLTKESVAGTTLSIIQDKSSNLSAALNSFIKSYNETLGSMKNLGYYDPSTKQAGALQGDSLLRSAQSQIRSWLFESSSTGDNSVRVLSDIGVSVAKDGTLSLDSTKLNKAIQSNFTAVSNLVADVGSRFSNGLEKIVGINGSLATATENANKSIASLQERQEEIGRRIETVRSRYVKQFTTLDSVIASYTRTGTYLSQQLASLPGANSKD